MSIRFAPAVTAVTAALAALLVLHAPSFVAAQDADEDARTEEARTLFQEGLSLAREERFEEAAALFRRAYLLRAAPAIALNFGNSLVHSGKLVEGTEMLRQVTRDGEAPRDLRRQAADIIEEAEPRIGRLVVHVEGEPEGAIVAIDGSALEVASYGVPVSADPGANQITASRGGEVVASTSVEVPEGGEAEVSLEVPPPPPLEPDAPPPILPVQPEPDPYVDDGGDGVASQWWFWTVIGVVVAGGVLAAVLVASGGGTEEPIAGTTQPGVLTWD